MDKQNKNTYKFLFVLIFLFLIIMLISAQKSTVRSNKNTERETNLEDKFRCGEWGICSADYKLDDFNYDNIDLNGIQKRVCLDNKDNNKEIIKRRPCDPSVKIKIKKSAKGLEVSGPKKVEGILPSVKKTDRGIGIFEADDFKKDEKEDLVAVIGVTEGKLDIEILI